MTGIHNETSKLNKNTLNYPNHTNEGLKHYLIYVLIIIGRHFMYSLFPAQLLFSHFYEKKITFENKRTFLGFNAVAVTSEDLCII